MSTVPVIAIDGPSGSGKGTISQAVARALGWHFLDSGALYRVLAFAAGEAGVDAEADIAALAGRLALRFDQNEAGEEQIWLADREISGQIRTERAGDAASRVAAMPAVRQALVAWQHRFRQPPGLVADGRDMGTVIFPDAEVKIFLDASAEERARRRHNQLKGKEKSATFDALFREIQARDERDRSRSISPLRPADDAVVVDTTGISIDAVVAKVLEIIRKFFPEEV